MTPEMQDYIRQHASRINVQAAALMAVVKVESNGSGFTDDLVTIRWEGHYFWRLLPTDLRNVARSQGLADPRAQSIKNPRSMAGRHALLARACLIDAEAAHKSMSMGAGQVMGDHAERLGYRDVFAMWDAAHNWQGQIDQMVFYIERFGLVDELQRLDFAGFARGYNGSNYRRFAYDTKLQREFENMGGSGSVMQDQSLRMGDRRVSRVKALQQRLSALGYHVVADGDFGPATKQAVQAFQLRHGLTADGVVGPITQSAVDSSTPPIESTTRSETTAGELADRSRIARNSATLRNTGTVVAAGAAATKAAEETGVLETITEAAGQFETLQDALSPFASMKDFAADNPWLIAIGVGLAVAFLGHRILAARVEDHRSGKTI